MTLKRKSAGSFTDISTRVSRRLSGSWVDIDTIRRKVSGAWTVAWRRITLTDQSISHLTSGVATAGYRLNSTGIAEQREGGSYSTLETWIAIGSASSYECRATVTFGALTSGTADTWLNLGSSREWYVQRSTSGSSDCIIIVEIRNASTLAVVSTATIEMSAIKS